ncbi:MAG: hypothetical protein V4577_22150 [Bacteroidota bacterium]
MNTRILTLLIILTAFFKVAFSQETSPLIKGNVEISIKNGTIACDFVISDIPHIDYSKDGDAEDYVIRLNSGMNVHYFKDLKAGPKPLYYDTDLKDSIWSYETKAYLMHENRGNPSRYIPEQLEVKYIGWYPVIADSTSGYMGQDWRGNIAFNGYSVRADGLQSAWYPVIYNKRKQKLYKQVRYDIDITCNDCNMLFVNGSKPVRGKKANFVSNVPYEMAIYCGNYDAAEQDNTWLLNPQMTKGQEQQLFSMVKSFEDYYAKHLDIPYKGNLSFVQTTPTADPKEWAFAFNVSPTTINVGGGSYGLNALFAPSAGPRGRQAMAHELGHYYFGTLLTANTPYGPIISEGFAEFLSFKATKSIIGESQYQELLSDKIKALKYLRNYKSLSLAKTEDDFGNREYYLYYYTLVLFTAIEKEIGEETMWNWLKTMVTTKTDFTNYAFLESTFDKAVPNKALAERIKGKYFTSDKALENAIAEIGLK